MFCISSTGFFDGLVRIMRVLYQFHIINRMFIRSKDVPCRACVVIPPRTGLPCPLDS